MGGGPFGLRIEQMQHRDLGVVHHAYSSAPSGFAARHSDRPAEHVAISVWFETACRKAGNRVDTPARARVLASLDGSRKGWRSASALLATRWRVRPQPLVGRCHLEHYRLHPHEPSRGWPLQAINRLEMVQRGTVRGRQVQPGSTRSQLPLPRSSENVSLWGTPDVVWHACGSAQACVFVSTHALHGCPERQPCHTSCPSVLLLSAVQDGQPCPQQG